MGTKVVKFGGTSLADAGAIRQAAEIIRQDPERRYAVASAPGKRFDGDEKVTDLLLACYEKQAAGQDPEPVLKVVEDRYRQIIRGLEMDLSLEEEFLSIRKALGEGAGRDYLASRGEYLNGKVLAAYLGWDFLDAADGIFFKEDGSLDQKKTYSTLAALLKARERAVLPGFYGTGADGAIRTFTRGGSDVTGAIAARAAGADVYENWTDVSGMLMADPRYVENPETISVITYPELRELTYMGATVLHEEAVFPARSAKIPINIRNTRRPEDPGTWIVAEAKEAPRHCITGVAGRKGFASVTVEKDRMNAELGFGRKVLSVLENRGISFEHLPTGIDTLSVFVQEADVQGCRPELISDIMNAVEPDSVSIEDDLALIAVVGRGMVGAIGPASRLLQAVEGQGIRVRMIDQGSSGLNIIIGVAEADFEKALNAIYREFVK